MGKFKIVGYHGQHDEAGAVISNGEIQISTPHLKNGDWPAYNQTNDMILNALNSKKVFTCTGFEGHWPVGVSAVIVADNEIQAQELLRQRLAEAGLGPANERKKSFTLVEIDTKVLGATILQDGDY